MKQKQRVETFRRECQHRIRQAQREKLAEERAPPTQSERRRPHSASGLRPDRREAAKIRSRQISQTNVMPGPKQELDRPLVEVQNPDLTASATSTHSPSHNEASHAEWASIPCDT